MSLQNYDKLPSASEFYPKTTAIENTKSYQKDNGIIVIENNYMDRIVRET